MNCTCTLNEEQRQIQAMARRLVRERAVTCADAHRCRTGGSRA